MYLEQIHDPSDLKKMNVEALPQLCEELRTFLVDQVSRTGGHLASNLGVVELTVAIHRVFDTSRDRLVFDVGHQCYIHKILTGRREAFSTLRQMNGISGFPKPRESAHDAFVAGHASNSISVALGMARARTLQHEDYHVLALIGDGALTGGMSLEGLNDAGASGEKMIVILNDNGMSISRNVGGLSGYLTRLRNSPEYYALKKRYRKAMGGSLVGKKVYQFSHSVKSTLKKSLLPDSTFFENMGFSYLGPVDGHDVEQLINLLAEAKEMKGPVLLHVETVKGKGYAPAEQEPGIFHGVGPFDPLTGKMAKSGSPSFSGVFGRELLELAKRDHRICAITAAMRDGTGLTGFADELPDRFFDVGIAEGHAAAMAAGLASQGMIPVCAVYSTFLQRSYDQLLHDVSLLGLHVVFAVDRAGLVGADGETHHGCFDPGYLAQIPGMTVLCPSSFAELRTMLHEAIYECKGPVAIRYPRGGEGAYVENAESGSGATILSRGNDAAIVTYGIHVNEAISASEMLQKKGIHLSVIKLNRITPLPEEELIGMLHGIPCTFVLEDCVASASVGEHIAALLARRGCAPQRMILRNLGDHVPDQGTVEQLYEQYRLNAAAVAADIEEALS